MQIDLRIFEDDPVVLARITGEIARHYFNNVLRKGYDIKPVSDAYTIAFNLNPNYRIILKQNGDKRYQHLNEQMSEITSLPIK